jgi:toxin FitB
VTTVLDTNVLSELRLPNPDSNVVAWFSAQPQSDLAVASFSIAEIEYGIALAPHGSVLAMQLPVWLNAILATQRILPLDASAARVLGRLHAVPALRNLITAPPQASKLRFAGDLAIAATAVAHQASVATRNVADFRQIAQHCPGLAGINPWTGQNF